MNKYSVVGIFCCLILLSCGQSNKGPVGEKKSKVSPTAKQVDFESYAEEDPSSLPPVDFNQRLLSVFASHIQLDHGNVSLPSYVIEALVRDLQDCTLSVGQLDCLDSRLYSASYKSIAFKTTEDQAVLFIPIYFLVEQDIILNSHGAIVHFFKKIEGQYIRQSFAFYHGKVKTFTDGGIQWTKPEYAKELLSSRKPFLTANYLESEMDLITEKIQSLTNIRRLVHSLRFEQQQSVSYWTIAFEERSNWLKEQIDEQAEFVLAAGNPIYQLAWLRQINSLLPSEDERRQTLCASLGELSHSKIDEYCQKTFAPLESE